MPPQVARSNAVLREPRSAPALGDAVHEEDGEADAVWPGCSYLILSYLIGLALGVTRWGLGLRLGLGLEKEEAQP